MKMNPILKQLGNRDIGYQDRNRCLSRYMLDLLINIEKLLQTNPCSNRCKIITQLDKTVKTMINK